MDIGNWFRPRASEAGWTSSALLRAAAAGAEMLEIVQLAAREMCSAAQADRTGIWLLSEDDAQTLEGVVVEPGREPGKPEWRKLDRSMPFVTMLLSSVEPVVVDLHKVPQAAALGPLARMRTAAWIPLRMGGRPLGLALVAYLLSRLRVAPEVLRERADELAIVVSERRARGALERLQKESRARREQTEKLAALGQLVSGIAHELSNPLTSILGYAQLLLGARGGAERQAHLRRVYQEADRARRIVNNLLLFARESKPERRPADLNEIVERTLALRGYELAVENIRLEMDLASNLPPVLVDPHQIQQLLLNLVVNAEQAILEARAPTAKERTRGHIRVGTHAQGERVYVEVTDDGPGIPPESEARIFDPFFTTKPMGQGTGLGLSIAYEIAREHGGRIYVRRERPRSFASGATLVVELPVLSQTRAAAPAAIERALPVVVPLPGHKDAAEFRARVLVIEDEPTVAQLVTDVLAEQGHEVESVLDSREGLERARRNGYDLLLCDLRMPRLDGRGLYEALIESGADVRGRIIFITGDTLSSRTLDFLETNGLPYLAKPFLVEELKAVVNGVLARLEESKSTEAGRARPGPAILKPRKNQGAAVSDSRREAVRKK